ncbi:hypothetical protein GY45DRAFT_1149455 [Cubamyces sp. BRFM 1775]|nr:hypothetical protein GY45DRAFT_1149455 [Cubamyces sp. BRFM 1775]
MSSATSRLSVSLGQWPNVSHYTIPPTWPRTAHLCHQAGPLYRFSCYFALRFRDFFDTMHPHLPSVLSVTGLLFIACCADLASAADAPNVTWIAPSDGDSYASGDTIVGRWTSDDTVVSPSFRICVTGGGKSVSARSSHGHDGDDSGDDSGDDGDGGDDDDGNDTNEDGGSAGDGDDSESGSCGEAVWPTIGQSEDGSHFIHLSLPNVTSVAQCYLEMVDNFGDKMVSPTFSFGGSTDAQSTDTAASASDDSQSDSSGASSPTATSPASIDSSSPASNPSGTGLGAVLQTPNAPQTLPSLDESHVPVPTAAYAVPLSLVGSVILAAGGLSVHQRRKLKNERLQEQASLAQAQQKRGGPLSRHSTLSFAGFMNLGSRPHSSRAPSSLSIMRVPRVDKQLQPQTQSRSTSVNRTRAWRRDVSRHHAHERRPEFLPRLSDEDTLAWRTEDARSSASASASGEYTKGFTALPVRQEPRRATREPFHASGGGGGGGGGGGRARRTTVPASVFRAGASPVFPLSDTDSFCGDEYGGGGGGGYGHRRDFHYSKGEKYEEEEEDGEEEWGRLKREGRTLVDPGPLPRDNDRPGGGREAYLNASVNDSVMERYFNTSPVPPALSPGVPPRDSHSHSYARSSQDAVARPERLHVKRYAERGREDGGGLLPPAPRDAERDLYDAVARRISRGPDA